MIGILCWAESETGRGKAVVLQEKTILRLRVLWAEVRRQERTPEFVLRRRLRAALRGMRRAGVRRVILPENLTCGALLDREQLSPVSTLPLRRFLAAQWVQQALLEKIGAGEHHLAVSGDRMTGELMRTVTELSRHNRYVLVDVPYGGEALCRKLRRESGAALLMHPSRQQLEEADALVLFQDRQDLTRKNPVVLSLYEGGQDPLPQLLLSPELEQQLPPMVDRAQLLSFFQENGSLPPGVAAVAPFQAPA